MQDINLVQNKTSIATTEVKYAGFPSTFELEPYLIGIESMEDAS